MNTAARPALALIHGWGIGQAVWLPLRDALAEHADVHLVDLPGYAAAGPQPSSFENTALSILDSLPAGTILCGWSLGGMLALQAALLAPQRIGGLILIASSPSFTQRDDWSAAQAPTLLDAFTSAVAKNPASILQRFIALLNQGDTQAKAANRALALALAADRQPDTDSLIQGLNWLRDVDLRNQLNSIAVPALLIHGDQDPLMPLAAAQWLHKALANSSLEIIPGAAHAPFINSPERIAKLIGDYCHASALNQATRPRIV